MEYITNTITQIGKELSCDNDNGKIIVNKYDNKVSKLIFSFDEAITGRKYIALLNPVTKKYHIEPIINNEVVITTKISAYPGKWNLLLIATDDDYEIEDNNIDQSKVTYVSNTFGRIIVRDNFLDESGIRKSTKTTRTNSSRYYIRKWSNGYRQQYIRWLQKFDDENCAVKSNS